MTTVQAQEKFVTVNNVRLRYLDWGTEGKPPMICLHGHSGQAHIWDEFAEAMSPYYHVYAFDQRGHGGSQWAGDGYERERFVEDLAALVDSFGFEKVTLVGLSMGGWNSILYTPDHQDKVEKVILVDIGPEPSEESRQQRGSRPPTPLEFDSFDAAVELARASNPWATDARLRRDLQDRMKQREDGKWTWKADPLLLTVPLSDMENPESIASYWRSLEAIRCPIMEVRGLGSPLLSDDIIERMCKANPLFSNVDVEDAGHVVPVDKPEEFIQVTRGFLGIGD